MTHSITLNGREYTLHFTVNALCCLEEKTGLILAQLQGTQLSCLRGLLWCGLLEQEKGLTLQDAGDLIDRHLRSGGDLNGLSASLAAALEDACFFPKAGGNQAPAGSGARSCG